MEEEDAGLLLVEEDAAGLLLRFAEADGEVILFVFFLFSSSFLVIFILLWKALLWYSIDFTISDSEEFLMKSQKLPKKRGGTKKNN